MNNRQPADLLLRRRYCLGRAPGAAVSWIGGFAAGLTFVLALFAGCGPSNQGEPAAKSSLPPADAPEHLSGGSTPVDGESAIFEDITPRTGIDFAYRNGEEAGRYTILESLGGGVALLDYDRDGLVDIYATGGGTIGDSEAKPLAGLPGRLYRNLGDWNFADVTAAAGLDVAPFYSHAALAADLNGDGWLDLVVTGYGGIALYLNEAEPAGTRRFVDATRRWGLADLPSSHWFTAVACGDLLGSGRADLYVCGYLDWSSTNDPHCSRRDDPTKRDVCPPERFGPLPDHLYENRGDSFAKHPLTEQLKPGKGLGVLVADLNADRRPDLYIANDAGDNALYFNRGGGQFDERGVAAGVATDDNGRFNGSMGLDVGDFDGSGQPSLVVTNYQGELTALYRAIGSETFHYQSQAAGLGAAGLEFVGFGVAFVDYDRDGWLDLAAVNGHVLRHPVGSTYLQRPLLWHNVAQEMRRVFREASAAGGEFFARPALGRGLAAGDLDNDGWPDLVVSQANGPLTVLRNRGAAAEKSHWLGVRLASRGNRPIAGATVRVEAAGRTQTRFVASGNSYLSTHDERLLFGLGSAAAVESVTVDWPWGERQTWDLSSRGVDRYWRLVEGETEPVAE